MTIRITNNNVDSTVVYSAWSTANGNEMCKLFAGCQWIEVEPADGVFPKIYGHNTATGARVVGDIDMEDQEDYSGVGHEDPDELP